MKQMYRLLFVAIFCLTTTTLIGKVTTEKDGFKWESFYQHGYAGAKNEKGKVIIQPRYNSVEYDNGTFYVKNNCGQIGAFEKNGNLIFPAYKYTAVYETAEIKDSPFIVVGEGYGAVNRDGKILLPDEYTNIKIYGDKASGYHFMLWKNGFMGVAEMNGKVIIPPTHYNAIGRHVGDDNKIYFIYSKYGEGSGVCNEKGEELINTKYFLTFPKGKSNNQYYEIIEGNCNGQIDLNGNLLSPLNTPTDAVINKVYVNGQDYLICRDGKNKYYVKTTSGKIIIEPKYDFIDFYKNYFTVRDKQYMGIINTHGKIIISPEYKYSSIGPMENYIIGYTTNNTCALHKLNGELIYPARHKNVSYNIVNIDSKCDTLISFKDSQNAWGIKTMDEKILVDPIWDDLNVLESDNGLYFYVFKNGKVGLQDINGRLIFRPEYKNIKLSTASGHPFFYLNTGYMGIADLDGNIIIQPEIFESMQYNSSKKQFIGEVGKRKCVFDINGKLLSDNKNDVKRDEYIDLGDEAFDKGKYKVAVEYYGKALNISPSAAMYFNRGVSYYNLNKYYEAISDFRYALNNNPSERIRDKSLDLIEKAEYYQQLKEERRNEIVGAIFGLAVSGINYALQSKTNKLKSNNAYTSGNTYSSGNSSSYESSNNGVGESSTSSKAKKRCGFCAGQGSIVEYTANYGTGDTWCEKCDKKVAGGHYHKTCTHCKGAGEY